MDERDMTEEEFLAAYDASRWPHPAVTADIAVFRNAGSAALQVLLIQRGNHPYKGGWALPGGFFEPGETIEACAARELMEETGIAADLAPVGFYSTPGRDPRDWVTTRSFVALVDESVVAQAGDDAAAACWFDVAHASSGELTTLTCTAGGTSLAATFETRFHPITNMPHAIIHSHQGFAFDHYQIVADAWLALGRA